MDIKEITLASDRFDLSAVKAKFIKDYGCDPSLAEDLEREVKRFLVVASNSKDKSIRLHRNSLDDFWHVFILHTNLYQDYCDSVLGIFVHHMPGSMPASQAEIIKRDEDYQHFLQAYENIYQESPPVHLWPQITNVASGSSVLGCVGCSGCGVHWRAYV